MSHPYGPNRPDDQPTTVDIYPHGKWTKATTVPISPAVLKQRAHINHRAHKDASR